MICIRFETLAVDVASSCLRATVYQTSGNRFRLSRDPAFGLLCFIKHLRCYLCCQRRLATSQACAPAYRRSTASVSSATLAVLGCRVASSPSDEEDVCLWISALRLPSSALPKMTVVTGYSMAGRGLFRNARSRTIG